MVEWFLSSPDPVDHDPSSQSGTWKGPILACSPANIRCVEMMGLTRNRFLTLTFSFKALNKLIIKDHFELITPYIRYSKLDLPK